MLSIQTTSPYISPSTQQQTSFKLYLSQDSNQYLFKSKRVVVNIARHKEQVTTTNIKKEHRLCTKSPAPDTLSAKDVFQTQPPFPGVNF